MQTPPQHTPPRLCSLRKALLGALLPITLGLSGCAALERAQMRPTEVYYLASTPERFAPKPPEYDMPILSRPPIKARNIGAFQFTTESGRAFATKSAIYNGRRVGADAIWVRNIQEWAEPYAYDIPGHWETRWETRHERRLVKEKGNPGEPAKYHEEIRPVSVQRQEWVPTQHVSGFRHFTAIDAVMYRLQ
jgi:hypothetical protein